MAGEIGIIKTVLGTVLAIDGAGSPRKLLAGDRVFSDELIKTAAFAVVEIEFADGSTMDLGSNSLTSLGEMAALASNKSNEQDPINGVEKLQQAIAEGADPTVIAEAPAAGIQSSEDEGHTLVSIDYLAPEMTPDSGFETKGIESERSEFDDEPEDELETDVNDVPVAVVDTAGIFEDAVSVTGDVRANDTLGDGTAAQNVTTLNDLPLGDYGTIVLDTDGSYTYTLGNTLDSVQQLAPGETLTETYEYTLTDEDGDTSITTLTITITGADDPAEIVVVGTDSDVGAVTEDVDTDGVTAGIQLIDSGTLSITDPDSSDPLTFSALIRIVTMRWPMARAV